MEEEEIENMNLKVGEMLSVEHNVAMFGTKIRKRIGMLLAYKPKGFFRKGIYVYGTRLRRPSYLYQIDLRNIKSIKRIEIKEIE